MKTDSVKLAGVIGYAGSGKDESAKALLATGWERLAFADPLKQGLEKALEYWCGPEHPKLSDASVKSSLRPLLVEAGRSMRKLDPDFWVDTLWRINSVKMSQKNCVITDVRYLNEAKRVLESGGFLVFVNRNADPANEEERNSIQQILDSGIPITVIQNDGEKSDLHRRMLKACGCSVNDATLLV